MNHCRRSTGSARALGAATLLLLASPGCSGSNQAAEPSGPPPAARSAEAPSETKAAAAATNKKSAGESRPDAAPLPAAFRQPRTVSPDAGPSAATLDGLDRVGVPECDEYLAKYYTCVMNHIPEASRAVMLKSMKIMSEAWKKAAATDAGKTALGLACQTASQAAKTAMTAFKCKW